MHNFNQTWIFQDGPKLSLWLPKNYEKMTESKGTTGFGRKIIPNKKGKEIVVYEAPDGSDLASFDEILKYLTSAGNFFFPTYFKLY